VRLTSGFLGLPNFLAGLEGDFVSLHSGFANLDRRSAGFHGHYKFTGRLCKFSQALAGLQNDGADLLEHFVSLQSRFVNLHERREGF